MVRKYSVKTYIMRLARLEKSILEKCGAIPLKVARYGAQVAAQQAPQDTGALIQSLGYKGSKKKGAEIIQLNPGKMNPNRQGLPFNYAEAMRRKSPFYSPKIAGRIRTGNPDYFDDAINMIKSKFGTDIKKTVEGTINTTK